MYLSGGDDDLLFGNFIADHLKGEERKRTYPLRVRQGIQLHRAIDQFTDQHAVVNQSKIRVREAFGKYAPVIVDVFYDHFLAANWMRYHPTPLPRFAQTTYEQLLERKEELPAGARHMLPYMVEHDWLTGYSVLEGIVRVMQGMSRRARFDSQMDKAPDLLRSAYPDFEAEFNGFFPELEAHAAAVRLQFPTT